MMIVGLVSGIDVSWSGGHEITAVMCRAGTTSTSSERRCTRKSEFGNVMKGQTVMACVMELWKR